MPAQKRTKTQYPGVTFIEGVGVDGKPEKIFYIRYRKNGKMIEEKAGRARQDDMTAAKANKVRADRISGALSNQERREAEEQAKKEAAGRWTIDKLWNEYKANRAPGKGLDVDTRRYEKYLKGPFGNKEPKELLPLDVDRLRIKLLKQPITITKRAKKGKTQEKKLDRALSPQSVKHVLNLLTWIVNFGVKKNLCQGLNFHIQKPTVYNVVTEDLSDDQLKRLMDAIEKSSNVQIKNLMKLVLCTGMRRGETLKLQWSHIDFDRGFIRIVDPKGGPDQTIPLNDAAREILEKHPRHETSEYVFPGADGKQRKSMQAAVNKIKKEAGLPKTFRPLHGLRHLYASMLASSGRVDMYMLQRLLTHKDPRMTQRYAHLRDEALKDASNVAGDILNNVMNSKHADVVKIREGEK